jgi:hypothetical protein
MKQYIINFQTSTESYTDCDEIATFTDLKKAQKEFKKAVFNAPKFRQIAEEDFKEFLTESIVLEEWEGKEFIGILSEEVIYSEGVIDRMNYKGNYPINYYFRATFNGKELMHTMYYDNKKEMWGNKRKVPNSQLDKWYYR